eukprot:TRINITY_DN43753_c0_g1_i1.p1 TRINITY_DN43753_c0_g1~~TRINITY_DN43753_c0_g1_i1.p1  ORF type:complete len:229 (-),score=28.95 TRINITY_DN43753_c0_g1_i1:443-1129(-)
MQTLQVRTVNSENLDLPLHGIRRIKEVRQQVAAALGVQDREFVDVKLLNGDREINDEVALDDLDTDAGLLVVLSRVIPDWYPRHKYVHHDQEVLRITGIASSQDGYVAEFVDGSTDNVDVALVERAEREWSWQKVNRQDRIWLHPPEKPAESGGWYDIFTSENVRIGATRSVGMVTGFLVGVCGPQSRAPTINGNGNFETSFNIGFVVGFTAWGVYQVVQIAAFLVRK